jgi:hypothetical protein
MTFHKNISRSNVCVCVCVWEREGGGGERERENRNVAVLFYVSYRRPNTGHPKILNLLYAITNMYSSCDSWTAVQVLWESHYNIHKCDLNLHFQSFF